MTKEHQLLILLSKARWTEYDEEKCSLLVKQQLNWDHIFTQLFLQKLAAIAYYHLDRSGFGENVPWLLLKGMLESQKIIKVKQQYRDEEVIRICSVLNATGIPYCMLKGYVLQQLVYPTNTRHSSDVDILIGKSSYQQIDSIMRENGYVSERDEQAINKRELLYLLLNTYEFPAYRKKIQNEFCESIEFDFQHSHSFFRQMGYRTDAARELRDACFLMQSDTKIFYQNPYDLIIHLCTHAFGDSTVISEIANHKAFRLRLFADINGLLDMLGSDGFSPELLARKTLETNTQLPVYFSLFYCQEIYGEDASIAIVLSLLREEMADDRFINLCGMENGMENAIGWDDTLEEKLFEVNSTRKIEQAFRALLHRYSKYDVRMRNE